MKPPIRVLVVHPEAVYYGGAEVQLLRLLEALDPAIVALTIARVPNSPLAHKLTAGVKQIDLPNNQKFSLRGFLRQRRTLLAAHRSEPFDIAHGWTARSWESLALLRQAGLPTIGTLHDHPNADYISPIRQRLMKWLAHLGLGRVVCVSEALARECRDAGYPNNRIETIHNGLLVKPGTPKRLRQQGDLRLGFIGNLAENKGLRGLFEIIDIFNAEYQGNWEILIAGQAQDEAGSELVSDLKNKQSRADWRDRVKWLNWIDDPDAFFRKIDLLLFPSLAFETFGMVIAEAGLAGIPVLAADFGAVPEIIVDGNTGWLFPHGNWKAAAQRLVEVSKQRENWGTVGDAARQRISNNFNIMRMADDYTALYQRLA